MFNFDTNSNDNMREKEELNGRPRNNEASRRTEIPRREGDGVGSSRQRGDDVEFGGLPGGG